MIKGKIEKKDIKSGEKNNKTWQRVTYTINKEKYSSFDLNNSKFNEGDYVELEFEEVNGYKNIKTIKKIDSQNAPHLNGSESMYRCNALNNATQICIDLDSFTSKDLQNWFEICYKILTNTPIEEELSEEIVM
jgi:hypothetical protein